MYKNIALIGANGTLGQAFLRLLAPQTKNIYAFSRYAPTHKITGVTYQTMDYMDEDSIKLGANSTKSTGALDLVLVTIGILHTGTIMPEKSLRDINADNMQTLFMANTVAPSLIAKYFLPCLHRHNRAIFATISARVGSISDNRLGGWYAYRTAKAGLNMMIKGLSIEVARKYPNAIVVGLHPGTVNSPLSKPFQKNVPIGKLFTPNQSAQYLYDVLNNLQPKDTGLCFAWDGQQIYS